MGEHLFGTLKGQFKRLKLQFDKDKISDLPVVIIATCILHNISILNSEEIMYFLNGDGDDGDMHYDFQDIFPPNRNGDQKRNGIMNMLAN